MPDLFVCDLLDQLGRRYAAWWVDALGEHSHVGGESTTRWLLDRSGLASGKRMLDCGAFVGAAARLAARKTGAAAVATDLSADFLAIGRRLEGGHLVSWIQADSARLPFADAKFDSAWALDTAIVPRELSRVAKPASCICLCCEVPEDSRGGMDAFLDEWAEFGFTLAAHRTVTSDALMAWRRAEAELVARRHHFEERYGTRRYFQQLDMLAAMVQSYERGEQGHGLFVFGRGGAGGA